MSKCFEEDFLRTMHELHFETDAKERMLKNLLLSQGSIPERMQKASGKWTIKRTAVAAAACIMLTALTVFAASRISYYIAFSRSEYDYKTAEEINAQTQNRMQDFPESFNNGFVFAGGKTVHVEGTGDPESSAGQWNDLCAEYKNKSGKTVSLYISEHTGSKEERDATETRIISATEVRYDRDEYLVLPPNNDSELDEATRKRMESDDHFNVSYGSEEPETTVYKSISFTKSEILYHLFTSDNVEKDVLFQMASELIE